MTALALSIDDAMRDACREVGIHAPARVKPGRWVRTRVEGKSTSNRSGAVLVFPDERGGEAWNWSTGQSVRFRVGGDAGPGRAPRYRPDPETERRREAERRAVAATCERIVRACTVAQHPYLSRKGFLEERGLVIGRGDLAALLTEPQRHALPEGDGPLLVVPGRIGKAVSTVQFIPAEGAKKNILGGLMGGASHRIATGRETWVCEGIATALSVRAALRLLGCSATVLCAFAANNVAKVAAGIPGAIVAADHDKPLSQPPFNGLGTGEYWARESGRPWGMPPDLGDWNDMHMAQGLRAVALALRGVRPP